MSSLLLLEPYRTALMMDGYDHGYVRLVGEGDISENPAYHIGKDPALRQAVREMALFHDELLMIYHEGEGNAEVKASEGHAVLSALNLEREGIVRFPEVEPDVERHELLQNEMKTLSDWWVVERDLIDTWKPLIASQIVARGKMSRQELLDVLMAERTRNPQLGAILESLAPPEKAEAINMIELSDPLPYDFIVFSTLNELLDVDKVVRNDDCRVAIDGGFGTTGTAPAPQAEQAIYRVMIEELLQEEFRFPVCDDLRELRNLRARAEIQSFRDLFQPWLERLATGDKEEEPRLRQEVKKAMRQFRNAPRLQIAQRLSAIVALPVGLVPGAVIAGAVLSLASVGLGALAKRWREKTRWIGLCGQ